MSTGASQLYDWQTVARAIDHTILKPDAREEHIRKLCAEAVKYEFAAVCVQPCYVPLAAELLRGKPVKVASVVGFPHGATFTSAKTLEAAEAVRSGAREVDMVINVGALKDGRHDFVLLDIRSVADITHLGHAALKVIIETALLTKEEKIAACELALEAGADFVKTSTGFAGAGATADDVKLMRSIVGQRAGVKAAGGIRTAADAIAMLAAGANRIGASASVAIVKELGAPE
jgi:deoxyribose-phosphate aldolase